ncbi:HAD-IIIA family hydrolase [Bradyrhizobium diazoefficiens]|uniref:HAD-IIIA family hydrolase n=1 Tax=Bradyrhizobium diazoefficiens TaxID=1355477 RepID=UPI001FEF0633|nr:HAD-IIIA family hydrolase [Bradyrhizobium diazoefficiens]
MRPAHHLELERPRSSSWPAREERWRFYVFEATKFEWKDGAREAVKLVNDAGYFAFVVTNQSGVARGFFEESHVQALHRWIAKELAVIGAHIDAFEYCPDHPEATVERYRRVSDRRKPAPGMIIDLLKRFPVATDRSTSQATWRRPKLRAFRAYCFRMEISKRSCGKRSPCAERERFNSRLARRQS